MKPILPSRIPLCMLLLLPAMLMAQEAYIPLQEAEYLFSVHLIPHNAPLISSTVPTIPRAMYLTPQATPQVQYNGNGIYHTSIASQRTGITSPLHQTIGISPAYSSLGHDHSSLFIYHGCAIPLVHTQGTLSVSHITQDAEKNTVTIRHNAKANPAPSHTTPIGDSLIPLLLATILYILHLRASKHLDF